MNLFRDVKPTGDSTAPMPPITRRPPRGRRALILVVVLVMVVLLALLAASYAFMANASLTTVMTNHHRFQARMAAESGVQRAIVMLRGDPEDPDPIADLDLWFDNPDAFRAAFVYGREQDREGVKTFSKRSDEAGDEDPTYDPTAEPIWRFNLVAPNTDEPGTVRYGITDECARLDLNQATEAQLRTLFELVIPEDTENPVDMDELIDSLLDWRASGTDPRPAGAKDEYYQSLHPPYKCKSASFSTVEELLLVRGFTGWVVFGEDHNRNGLLNLNEDDGDESFPPDNADGFLFPGVASFLTVWAREMNTSDDNRPRINLNMQDLDKLQEKLEEYLSGDVISYIMDVRAAGKTFSSVMNLIPAPPPPEEDESLLEGEPGSSSVQEPGEGTSPQPGNENPGETGQDLSDLVPTENTSENAPAQTRPVYQNLTEAEPPGSYEDLPVFLDRLTAQALPGFRGRINVSTAPREVLATLDELTDEELDAIVAARRELTGEEKATPAWLLIQGLLDENKFRGLLDGTQQGDYGKITAKSSAFRIESVGYADHLGVVERLNVVIEMSGPVPQVLYYRNLGHLGPSYSPHGEESIGLTDRTK